MGIVGLNRVGRSRVADLMLSSSEIITGGRNTENKQSDVCTMGMTVSHLNAFAMNGFTFPAACRVCCARARLWVELQSALGCLH